MAVEYKRYKEGSVECELITGVELSTTGEEEVTHHLGQIPDVVLITNTAGYSVYKSSAATASVVKITGGNADAACEILVKKLPL